MSKKSFTAFILLLIVVIGGAFWYFFFRDKAPSPTDSGINGGDDLFPFGQGPTGSGGQGGTSTTDTTIDLGGGSEAVIPRLRKIWGEPTAGAVLVASGTRAVSARFVDRATGHIYDMPVDGLMETKLSNVTIPQIYEALWSSTGNEVIMRYLKDGATIESFYGVVSTSTTAASPLEGYFLTAGIREIAVLGSRVLYLNPTASNGSFVTATMSGTNKSAIMSSEFKGWLISWNSPSHAFISSRPSGVVDGFGYILNTGTGTTTKIADGIRGLTGTINPSGDRVILSAHDDGAIATAAYSAADRSISLLSISTLSDKCAWSTTQKTVAYCAVPNSVPQGTYPDDWYLGVRSFSDKLWRIDVASGETDIVFDPLFDALEEMDMFKLTVSVDDSYLLFTNKKDMSLWLYRLE